MFGNQLISGVCGCGCAAGTCVQAKLYSGAVASGPGFCADSENIRTWLNNSANDPSPGWTSQPSGWEILWYAQWDTTSNIVPDSGTIVGPSGSVLPGGGVYPGGSQYTGCEGASNKMAFLLPSSTAYIVGVWCEDGTPSYQQACVMTGVAEGDCFQFDIPIPEPGLCSSEDDCPSFPCAVSYLLIPISDYGGWFGQTWDGFVSDCAAHTLEYPCVSGLTSSPGACLSPDPFYGDDAP